MLSRAMIFRREMMASWKRSRFSGTEHGDEQPVHPVADPQLALLGLEMDVRRLVGDGLRDDVAHEAHDGGVLVHVGLGVPLGLRGDVALVAVLERAGADAEVLDDELVHALGHRHVPDDGPRRERPKPVGHRRVGKPGGGEVQRGRRRGLGIAIRGGGRAHPDRDQLEVVDEARRQEPARAGVRLQVRRDVEACRLGHHRERGVLVNREGVDECREPHAAGRLEHRLALLVRQARGDRLGEGVLLGGGHGFSREPLGAHLVSSLSMIDSLASGILSGFLRN
jgi:hypothetical protein